MHIKLLAKKRKRILATILGFAAAAFFATVIALSVVEKPLSYDKQTKEAYLALQEDKNVAGFRSGMKTHSVSLSIIKRVRSGSGQNPMNDQFVYYRSL